ncbi:MAG: nicotinate-nucleotide--dimethylbenzimidazole phosphoribosyltransferase [Celeribacter sp.]|jgi:nicotinate-nucleotide--dimethylbenzimidazole phosphoribosyltransferase
MTAPFQTLDAFRSLIAELPGPDLDALEAARARNARLVKPVGALGRMEDLAIWYAGWRGSEVPVVDQPQIVIFAATHGVAERDISAHRAAATHEMVENFALGGAAINQLAQSVRAMLQLVELDLDQPSADISTGPALSDEELLAALRRGWDAVNPHADLLVPGDMAVGNTTCAATMAAALHGGDPAQWVGKDGAMDDAALARKVDLVDTALRQQPGITSADPLAVLRGFGGRDIAAMTGAIVAARAQGTPVILDSYACCAAAAVLAAIDPTAIDHVVAGQQGAEPGQGLLLQKLGLEPLLSLGLNMGEGCGGALAIGVIRSAVACHAGMIEREEVI